MKYFGLLYTLALSLASEKHGKLFIFPVKG